MFSNVLIGVDGREGGRDAMALARELAAPGATFALAHVYTTFRGRGTVEADVLQRATSERLLERERELADLDARVVVRGKPSIGEGLHLIAEKERADLLVVGSTRRALLGRVLLGDDCRASLNGAPCATAIAPRGYARGSHALRRLGVGYDATPESEHALSEAREIAAEHGADIRALWVVTLSEIQEEKPIPADWPEATDELIERHTKRLEEIDDVTGVVTYGGPREELVKFGRDLDLLIVGTRGYGALSRVLHGSVSRYLAGHMSCPLIVIPRGGAAHPDPATEHDAKSEVLTAA